MPTRKATATWKGDLKGGSGSMSLGSGAWEGAYSFSTRFENEPGTNPEELVGAAHAGCFSMAFSNELDGAGFTPNSVDTTADVHLEKTDAGFRVTRIHLTTVGDVPNISDEKFQEIAEAAKNGCPISNLLTGAEITLDASLK